MMHKKLSLLLGLLAFSIFFSQQGRKEQLQKQNSELKKQIAAINATLAKARGEAKLSLAYLNDVNKKIALRERVYNNTQKEKRFIEDEIYLRQLEINKFNRELKVLRKEYADILVKAYKNKGVQNKVTFILSSRDLGEALRRVQYIKQYGEYQDKKAAEINQKATQIKKSIGLKQKSVKEKENLLNKQKQELAVIQVERKQKEVLLEEFKKNEAKLVAELRTKQAENKKVENAIRNLINEEIKAAKAKAEADKKAEAERIRLAKIAAEKEKAKIDAENKAKADALALAKKKAEEEERKATKLAREKAEAERVAKEKNDAEKIAKAEKEKKESEEKANAAKAKADEARNASKALADKTDKEKAAVEEKKMKDFGVGAITAGSNFAANKGKMSFPVPSGQVTERFGRQPHPVFKGITIENNGIKVVVPNGTRARCVFPGVVSNILVSGGAKTVLVKHGDYFSIYGNLDNVNVAKNQQVSAGTTIGSIGTDFDGNFALDFQIWNGANPVNPLDWVSY